MMNETYKNGNLSKLYAFFTHPHELIISIEQFFAASRHDDIKVQLILLQKECMSPKNLRLFAGKFIIGLRLFFFWIDDDNERILNNVGVSEDTIPSDIQKTLKQMANFIGASGLVFIDKPFLMEWYIAKCEKRGLTKHILNKVNHNIAMLEKRIAIVDSEQAEAEKYVLPLFISVMFCDCFNFIRRLFQNIQRNQTLTHIQWKNRRNDCWVHEGLRVACYEKGTKITRLICGIGLCTFDYMHTFYFVLTGDDW